MSERTNPKVEVVVAMEQPNGSHSLKGELYCLRGEILAVASTIEWIVHELIREFDSPLTKSGKTWPHLKRFLGASGLIVELEQSIKIVDRHFRGRNIAAHEALIVAAVGATPQVFRLSHTKNGTPRIRSSSIDEFRAAIEEVKGSYRAIQAIGKVLDTTYPGRLISPFRRPLLIGGP